MSASDHLGKQFVTVFHGTHRDSAQSIVKTGLHESSSNHIYPAKWMTVTENRQTADAYANAGGATVEMHVPRSHMDEYFWPAQEHMGGNAYAVKKDIPPKYVAGVHNVDEQVDYP